MLVIAALCVTGSLVVSFFVVSIAVIVGEAAMVSNNYDTDIDNMPSRWSLCSLDKQLIKFNSNIHLKTFSRFFIRENYTEFYVKNKRGRTCLWWFYEPGRVKTVIVFPGSKLHIRSASSLLVAGMFWKLGYNVAMVEYLDHGDTSTDDGRRNSGVYEKYDCVDVYDYIRKELNVVPTHAFGQYMGGTAAVLLSQYRKLEYVISDSAPLRMCPLIADIYSHTNLGFLRFLCGPITGFYMRSQKCYIPEMTPNPYCKYILIYNRHDSLIQKKSHVPPFSELSTGNISTRILPGGRMHGPFLCTDTYYTMLASV